MPRIRKPQLDVSVENHNTVFLFRLHSKAARQWVEANVPEPMSWGGALVCEHRYAEELAAGMKSDGLKVE